MVAPHETGDLVRSLVRVPGSGRDSTLESKCLNLSNVSTAAAAVHVPSTLPSALANSRSQNQNSAPTAAESNASGESNHLASSTEKKTANRKRPLQQESVVTENHTNSLRVREMNTPPAKRPRIVYMAPEQILRCYNGTRNIPTASGSLTLNAPNQTAHQQQLNFTSSTIASPSVSQLLQERDTLREENRVLQRQLLLFQQLMNNKERLASVVRRLGVKIPQS